jgi:hypothetical protein
MVWAGFFTGSNTLLTANLNLKMGNLLLTALGTELIIYLFNNLHHIRISAFQQGIKCIHLILNSTGSNHSNGFIYPAIGMHLGCQRKNLYGSKMVCECIRLNIGYSYYGI